MAPEIIPFYQDWAFWAVVVAAVAIVLSQLPPVLLWFKKAQLDLDTYSRIHVSHKVGNPNLQLHLILSNIGGRTVKIKSIGLKIKRDGNEVATLSAMNYLPNPNEQNTVLFTRFTLTPKEEWARITNFLNFFSRDDEKKYKTAEVDLRNDILAKRKQKEDEDALVESTADLITPFYEIFNSKFIWLPGEYEMTVSVDTSPEEANLSKKYRFTLFESDSADLSKVKKDFKYGDGIYWDSGRYAGIIVQISEA